MNMDINNEIRPISYDLPYAVDITLYKYNHLDNLIISQLRKNSKYEPVPGESSFIVTVEEFIDVIEKYFVNELIEARLLTDVTIKNGVNSIYFLDRIFNNFHNLEYVKVNISNTRKFSRLLNITKERQVISFDYRIITSVVNLSNYFTTDESLNLVNAFFIEIGIIETDHFDKGKSYYSITTQDFMAFITSIEENYFEDESFETQYTETMDILYSLIDQKSETDNTRLIIITDYPD